MSADRSRRLLAVASELSDLVEIEPIARVAVEHGVSALGAKTVAIWVVDPSGHELTLLHSFGYPEESRASLLRVPLDRAIPITDVIRSGEPLWIESRAQYAAVYPEIEARSRHMEEFRIIGFACIPLHAGGRVIGVINVAFDDQRKIDDDERTFLLIFARNAGQALARARLFEETQQAIQSRDEFLSIAGHELNTPLTSLKLHLQGMERLELPAPARDKLAVASRQVSRLAKLVSELLDVSRISSGRLALDVESFDLADLVRDAMSRLSEDAARSGSTLKVDAKPTVGQWDRGRLDRVAINLLTNAIKYGGGKPIDVSVGHVGGRARLVVRDHGIGIEPEHVGRLFQRFERAVSARNYGGFGLGLWIARQIVEASGGVISVESVHGQGATFTVDLPLKAL